jgi:hypothetical protein
MAPLNSCSTSVPSPTLLAQARRSCARSAYPEHDQGALVVVAGSACRRSRSRPAPSRSRAARCGRARVAVGGGDGDRGTCLRRRPQLIRSFMPATSPAPKRRFLFYTGPCRTRRGNRRTLEFAPGDIQSEMLLSRPMRWCWPMRAMMCFVLFVPRPRHIVMVGLGGGSLAKFCHRHFPGARITVIELRADVIALRDAFHGAARRRAPARRAGRRRRHHRAPA